MSQTTPTCPRCERADARAEGLRREADQYREERDEWADSHRWLLENGWSWLGDLEGLLAGEQQPGESLVDVVERLVTELKARRAEDKSADHSR